MCWLWNTVVEGLWLLEPIAGNVSYWLSMGLVVLTVCLLYNSLYTPRPRTTVPGPLSVPILGSMLSIITHKDLRTAVQHFGATYGSIFRLDLGVERVVVLASFDAIKETLLKNGSVFADRPNNMPGIEIRRDKGIAVISGERWRTERHFIVQFWQSTLMSTVALNDAIMAEVHHLIKHLKAHSDIPIHPEEYFLKMAANLNSMLIFGIHQDYDESELNSFLGDLHTNNKLMQKGNILTMFPFLKYLPYDIGGIETFKKNQVDLMMFCRRMVDRVRKASVNLTEGQQPKNFVHAYLQQIEKHRDDVEPKFTEAQMLWTLVDLYMAGTDTTGIQLAWIVLYLVVYPEIQHKVQHELDSLGRPPVLDDRSVLHYTQAVLDEILRVSSVSPLAIPRATSEDITVCGHSLPKGTHIITSLYSVHRDPTLWPDPDICRPGRFLDNMGRYRRRKELIPFSIGRRNCIGERHARAALFLTMTTILHNFNILLPEGATIPQTEGIMGLMSHPEYFEVYFKERKKQ